MEKKEDIASKFHKNAKDVLQSNLVPGNKSDIKKKERYRRAEALKSGVWDKVVASKGNMSLTDIVNVEKTVATKFGESGFWSPDDFYNAYNKGYWQEVANLSKLVRGNKEKRIETIASIIIASPRAPFSLTKEKVINDLKASYKSRGAIPFLDRRESEIKDYLGKLGLDGSSPFPVVLKDEGSQLTHEKAEKMMKKSTTISMAPIPKITSMGKVITGLPAMKRKIIDEIINQATKMAGKDGLTVAEIKKVAGHRALAGDKKKGLKGIWDEFARQEDNFNDKKYRTSFLDAVTKELVDKGILVKDPESGIRANDAEMARYTLTEKGEWVRIGKTNNFMIPAFARYLTSEQRKNARSGELIFPVMAPGESFPIRMTGYMAINGKDDLDKLVKVLGTNPKNGFAPLGYDHEDKKAASLMNTFTVFVSVPQEHRLLEPDVEKVEKVGSKYVIKLAPDSSMEKGIPIHLWRRKPVSTSTITGLVNKMMDDEATKKYGRDFDDLTPEEKATVKLDESLFPEIWGLTHEYNGTLCQINERGSSNHDRLKILKSDLENSVNVNIKGARPPKKGSRQEEIEKENEAITKAKKSLINNIKKAISSDEKAALKKSGENNRWAIPNCAYIKPATGDTITIDTGDGTGYVEKKLDKIIDDCDDATDEKQCFLDSITVTQNLSHVKTGSNVTGIESIIYNAVRKSRTKAIINDEKDFKHDLSLIEKKIRTGSWPHETVTKIYDTRKSKVTGPARVTARRVSDVLDEARLLGKLPLDVSKWNFLALVKRLDGK
jgi:uncharacterized protein YozE (UPF0346 family)